MQKIELPNTFSERIKELAHKVHQWHFPQQRKYTNAPYSTHLIRVAQLVELHTQNELLIATALCHDVLEDTTVSTEELRAELSSVGYSIAETKKIVQWVVELTDVYVKADFPDLNRKARKAHELQRLLQISPTAASVKFADLIDNIKDIIPHDSGFAKIYIRETLPLLDLDCPYPTLQQLAKNTYANITQQLAL